MKRAQFKAVGLVLATLAGVLMLVTPAAAFEAKISGQVNHLVMWADDGDDSDFFVADNDNSSTRIRFTGEEDFGSMKAGFKMEIEAQRNASNNLVMNQTNDGSFTWNDRWLEAYFKTAFGKISIGKGDGAANGSSEVDLSGTSVINYSSVDATAGGFEWKINGVGSGVTVGDTRNNFDGLSRNERVRYDTPVFGGFSVAASVTNGSAYELAGWYSMDFSGNKIAAALAYVDSGDKTDDFGGVDDEFKQYGGSVSWLAPFGLNLTGAYAVRDLDNADIDLSNYYAKVGYKFDIHAFSIEYGMTKIETAGGDLDSSNYGLAYVVTPWKGIELYASYRNYMAEIDGMNDPDDIKQIMAGTRIKF